MRRCPILLLILLTVLSAAAMAAVPRSASRFDRLGFDDGLSQSVVVAILQDSSGFIWLATQDGLNRFDGYEFRVWRHDRQRTDSLSSSNITALAEGLDGRLWVGTTEGLDSIDPESGAVKPTDLWQGQSTEVEDRKVWSVAAMPNGDVFVGTERGIVRLSDGETGLVRCAEDPGRVVTLLAGRSGELWVGSQERGVFRVAPGGGECLQADIGQPTDGAVWGITEAQDGKMWFATAGGLVRYEPQTGASARYFVGLIVNHALVDRDGHLWVAFNGTGAKVLDPGSGEVLGEFEHDPNDPRSLSANYVNVLAEDASGTIWLGTWAGGVSRYSRFRDKFAHYPGGGGKRRLDSGEVYAFWADGDRLWVGTDGGLELFDRTTSTFNHRPVVLKPLLDGWIYSLRVDDRGRLWAGVYDQGLVIHDPVSGRSAFHRHDENDSSTIASAVINRIEPAGDGRMWLASARGVDLFDSESGTSIRFGTDSGLPVEGILALIVAQDGRVWAGTDGGGLAVLDPGGERFKVVYDDGSVAGVVLCLYEDSAGIIWAGTDGDGVVSFDPVTEQVDVLDEGTGLPNNVVYGICPDGDGGLWLSSNRGLARLDPRSREILAFDQGDGLQSNEFNQGAFHRGADGWLYFGGVNGFNHFIPGRVPHNPHPPTVVLTSLEIGNEPVELGPMPSGRPVLALPAGAATVSFRFAALDFTDPPGNLYRYRMDGFDQGWVEAGQRRFVTYTNLDPGGYTFRVIGSNADGLFGPEGLLVELVITPPIWQETWFLLLVAAAAGVVVFGGHRLRVHSIQRKRRQLELEVAERTVELSQTTEELREANEKKNLLLGIATHELRQPLNIINGYVDIVLSRLGTERFKHEEADKLLNRARKASSSMQNLIEDLLDLSAIESGKVELRLESGNMDHVLRECLDVHQRDAERKDITLSYQSTDLPLVELDLARMAEVVDNLISNAIKYTWPGGTVKVWTEVQDEQLVTHVRDSGQGLSEADLEVLFTEFSTLSARPTGGEKSTGLGLAIVRKLIRLHGGEVWAKSTSGEGSTFSFSLPRR